MSGRLLVMELGVRRKGDDRDATFLETPLVEGATAAPDPTGLAFARCLAHELGGLEGFAVIGTGTPLVILETEGRRLRGRGIPPAPVAREAISRASASHLASGLLSLGRDYQVELALHGEDGEAAIERVVVEGPDLPALLAACAARLAARLDAVLGPVAPSTPPQDAESLALLGRGLTGEPTARSTLAALEAVLAESPRLGPALFARARAGLERQDLPAMLRDLEPLSAIAPNDPAARALLGYAHMREGRLDAAREHLERAVDLSPSAPAHAWLAISLDGLGEHEAAERSFSSAHDLAPKDPAVLHDRAVLRLKLSRFADAREDLEAAARLDPRQTDRIRPALVAALRGEAAQWVQDPSSERPLLTRAATQLAQVVAGSTDDAVAWFLLGVARKRLGELPEATAALVRAAELDRAWPFPHMELAAVAAAAGRRKDAVIHARAALALAPDDVLALGNLGALLLLDNELPEAERLLHQALAADATNELARRSLDELERVKRSRKTQLRHLDRDK